MRPRGMIHPQGTTSKPPCQQTSDKGDVTPIVLLMGTEGHLPACLRRPGAFPGGLWGPFKLCSAHHTPSPWAPRHFIQQQRVHVGTRYQENPILVTSRILST